MSRSDSQLLTAYGRLTMEFSGSEKQVIEYPFGPKMTKRGRKQLDRRERVIELENAAQTLQCLARCIRGQLDHDETVKAMDEHGISIDRIS